MTPPFTAQHPTTCLRSFTNRASDEGVITRTYDALDRLLTETDAASDTIAYTYTARGPLATITDSRGAVTTFQYDLKDRLTAKVYDDTSSETSAYNAKDQLTAFTTARGITRTYTYDNRDRLTGVSYSDATPAVSFTYNAAGERLSANNSVAAVAHSYDAAGRTIAETHNITGHPLGARTLNLQHDVDSRLTRITYPDASQVDYGYDQRGRLASVTGAAFSVAYTRSLDNLVTGMSFSNGITSSRVFDADHRLLDIAYSQGSTVLSKAAYDLNSLGQRTRVVRANGLGDNFGYDAKDQVVAADYESAAPATAGLGSSTFNYDAMGNRTALSQQLVGGTLLNETYTANLLNQYTAIGSDAPVHDADGNLTSQGGAVLTYDGENRVTSITPALPVNGDERLTYSYDALGRRVAKDVETYQSGAWLPSAQTNYLYWDWNVLEEHRSVVVGAVSTHRYIWGEDLSGTFQGAGGVGGMLLQEVSGGTHAGARWFSHYDGNGNITELTDNTGNVVASYRYAVFGETMSATGPAATANVYRFSTKPLDVELASNSHTTFSEGLYYYGYRFYDAENGRWPSRDPIAELGGLNLYAFVGNHPIGRVDILGLTTDCGCDDQGNKINPVTDDAGAECCPDEISTITLNVDHGTIGHAWLNTPDGSYGHYPASPVPRLQGATEWTTGTGTARPGDTKSPDPHQTAHDQNNTNPDASRSYKYCPGSYQKLQDSIKNNTDNDYSVPNNPAENCVGWACGRIADSGATPPLPPSQTKPHPNDIR